MTRRVHALNSMRETGGSEWSRALPLLAPLRTVHTAARESERGLDESER